MQILAVLTPSDRKDAVFPQCKGDITRQVSALQTSEAGIAWLQQKQLLKRDTTQPKHAVWPMLCRVNTSPI